MRRFLPLLPFVILASLSVAEPGHPELTPATLTKWRTYLAPSAEEIEFREIPWRRTLYQAVVDARKAGKPILLWAMNGHPLGCT